MPVDRRTRKRLVTRETISIAATRLFLEQGFDQVTVDQIAAAADVGRMTVFNHFPRKEDMFFDRDEESREILRQAILNGDPAQSPIEKLQQLAHRLAAEQSPFVRFTPESQGFVATISASETLKARTRAIRDELSQVVALALSESRGVTPGDADAQLAATLFLASWAVALVQAYRHFQQQRDSEQAKELFLSLFDKGMQGVKAAMAGTVYI